MFYKWDLDNNYKYISYIEGKYIKNGTLYNFVNLNKQLIHNFILIKINMDRNKLLSFV